MPRKFWDDVCPISPPDFVSKDKDSKKQNASTTNYNDGIVHQTIETTKNKKMIVAQLKVELRNLNLSTQGLKTDLIEILSNTVGENNNLICTATTDETILAPVLL